MTSADIIATCSVVIAGLAFFATAWQTWLAYDHNRLSVKPLLVWHISRELLSGGTVIKYTLENRGLGPALIKDRYFTKDGKRFTAPESSTDEVSAFLEFVFGNRVQYHLKTFGLPGKAAAIPSGAEVIIGEIFFPGVSAEQLATIEKLVGDIDFHVNYESMYRQPFYFNAANEANT